MAEPFEGTQEFRNQQLDMLRMDREKFWVLHSADMHRDSEVRTDTAPRPFTLLDRRHLLSDLGDFTVPPWLFEMPERRLTPRRPYQYGPLSYVNAAGTCWSLFAQGDVLSWRDLGGEQRRYGVIEFNFHDVDPTMAALVTITADVEASSVAGAMPSVDVQASDASQRAFPVTGYASHTFDLVVRPHIASSTAVGIWLRAGITYFGFKSVEYQKLP